MGFEAQAHVYGPIFVFFLKRANDRSLAFFKKNTLNITVMTGKSCL